MSKYTRVLLHFLRIQDLTLRTLLSLLSFTVVILLAACQPAAPLSSGPTEIPFPTMTPGRLIEGVLPTVVGLSLDGSGLSNPATAIAIADRPTATPDYSACPSSGQPTLPPQPATGGEIAADLTSFLSAGGSPAALGDALHTNWKIFGDTGSIRGDVDLTGEGTPDVVITYNAPDDGGTILILTCTNGIYTPAFQETPGGTAPQLLNVGDMNHDGRADVVYSSYLCDAQNSDDCSYETQVITWLPDQGRFVSILNGAINSGSLPSIADTDNDQVQEIVVHLDNSGTRITGPLRTGLNIYDWNGTAYVLSIVQLDPPRFQVQVIQEADAAFSRLDTNNAISLYELASSDKTLHYWFNDEPTILKSYLDYRLMLAYAYTSSDKLLKTYQAAQTDFPDPANAPVYMSMVNAFWDAWQVTDNLHSACTQVQAIIVARPEALSLLNRYGSRSPTYTAQDLCPF